MDTGLDPDAVIESVDRTATAASRPRLRPAGPSVGGPPNAARLPEVLGAGATA